MSTFLKTAVRGLTGQCGAFHHARRGFHATHKRAVFIKPIPLREDNYGYLIIDQKYPDKAVLVDPYNVTTCEQAARHAGATEIVGNITTHSHDDHAGGNSDFASRYPKAPIYGASTVPNVTKVVGKDDEFPLFEGSSVIVKTFPTPCHTRDSISFYLEDKLAKVNTANHEYKRAIFSGDTLFISGCGRFFEGTAQDMQEALNVCLAALPGDTVVFCGHEYTKSNVAFSQAILPDDPAVRALVKFVREQKNNGVTMGVFTLDDEKRHNVFMRVDDPEVKQAMGLPESSLSIEVMAALREAKNEGKITSTV